MHRGRQRRDGRLPVRDRRVAELDVARLGAPCGPARAVRRLTVAAGTDDVKVLFLGGKGRSGGTLLASLLGQMPGFFNVGELNRLWDSGLVHNHRCGCGKPVQECPTWLAILEHADGLLSDTGIPPLVTARVDRDQTVVVRWPRLLRLFRSRVERRDRWKELERYTTAISAVYRSIPAVTGARVVVDSSRLPFEPVALGLVPNVDLRIGHLVRDPRAVVFSWKRSRVFTDRDTGEHLPRFGAAFSTGSWFVRNLIVERLRRRNPSITVNYDVLARDPAAVLRSLAELAGEPAGDLAFLTSDAATLAPTHSVGGNPVRMISGAIAIKPDEEWRHAMPTRDRWVSTLLALPLLRRYGFTIRTRSRAPEHLDARGRTDTDARAAGTGVLGMPVLAMNAWLRFDLIRAALRTARPESVLEIGAGEGGFGSWLARRYRYTAVEPDADSRATARARLAAVGRGEVVDELPQVGEQRFDAVCAFEVLEHIVDDAGALEQWRECLHPDGWLVMSVPAHANQYGPHDELAGHIRRYERAELESRLEKAGFRVVRVSSCGAGLGSVLQRGRDAMARRHARDGTLEERTSASGRYVQPHSASSALACAAITAPFRLLQRPFARTDIGTGYVVLARRAS